MAYARARKLKTGTFWYMVPGRHEKPEPCGAGKKGQRLAERWASRLNELRYLSPAGLPEPRRCLWILKDLKEHDLKAAELRGLRTSQPQFQGKISKRESHWRNLFTYFLQDLRLDQITRPMIRAYMDERADAEKAKERNRRPAGPATINRDLFGVLRPALAMARERNDESGFDGDPFAGIRKLDERSKRRQPITLSEEQLEDLIRIARRLRRRFGNWVELVRLTASRRHQDPSVDGGFLRYPAHKRGRPRAFILEGRLALLAKRDRAFSAALWRKAVKELQVPGLRPHDLRHSVLTLQARRPGASLEDLQKMGGWQSTAMADRYLHPDGEPICAARSGSLGGRPSRMKVVKMAERRSLGR